MEFCPTFPLARAHAISDYRTLARQRLPHFLFEYIDGGSFGEGTLHRNRTALDAITLNQRVLRDVSSINTSATLFGQNLSLPVILGPVGLAGMNARRGEVQAARAAEQAGIPFCLSTVSACSIGEVAAGTSRPFWFQLYMIRDRGFMRDLLIKAREEEGASMARRFQDIISRESDVLESDTPRDDPSPRLLALRGRVRGIALPRQPLAQGGQA